MSKKYIEKEYQKLVELTDNDQDHKNRLQYLEPQLCRYKEIYPYKDNIVQISNPQHNSTNEKTKFINGSWIDIPIKHTYIATQGPKDNTMDDFWQMCFDYNVNVIVMLCSVIENGKNKCSSYWNIETPIQFKTNFKVEEQNNVFVIRKIEVTNLIDKETKTFDQIQFTDWPDHQTPNIDQAYHNFEVFFKFVEDKKGKGPVVIHCSAGIGRTGVFATVQILYKEIMSKIKNGQDIEFNIFNTVRKIKECRLYSVDNINQYKFIYQLIEELLKEKNKDIKVNK